MVFTQMFFGFFLSKHTRAQRHGLPSTIDDRKDDGVQSIGHIDVDLDRDKFSGILSPLFASSLEQGH